MAEPKEVPAPRHAVEVRITIGMNDIEGVRDALSEIAAHFRIEGCGYGMCSGGWSGAYSVDLQYRDVTPEKYRAELLEWRKTISAASASPLHGDSDISGDRAAVAQEKEQ